MLALRIITRAFLPLGTPAPLKPAVICSITAHLCRREHHIAYRHLGA
jgi:hypothetical protein